MARLAFGENLALRGHRLFESTDVDETRDRIALVLQPHSLTPLAGAPCRFHMDYVRVGAIGFGAIKLGAMRVEVAEVADYHLAIFCLTGRAIVRTSGADMVVDDTVGAVLNPGQGFAATFGPDTEQFIMRLDRRRIRAHLGHGAAFERRMDLGRRELHPLLWQLRALHSDSGLARLAALDARLGESLESLMIGLLLQGQPQIHHASPTVSAASVRRAEAFMHAHYSSSLKLRDIAIAAGVAPRTLQEAFHRFRGTTPLELLRNIRLDRARAELRRATASVSDVALRCGYGHFGRFALAYRRRFGELPSMMRANSATGRSRGGGVAAPGTRPRQPRQSSAATCLSGDAV